MPTSAWFSAGAGTACTKHLFGLSRRFAAVRARRARGLETDLCPHAVLFKRLARRSSDLGQLVRGLGGGAEQSSSLLQDPDVKTERERVSYPRSEERRVGKECRSRWSQYH